MTKKPPLRPHLTAPLTDAERKKLGIKRSPDLRREPTPLRVKRFEKSPYSVPELDERWEGKDIAPFVKPLRALTDEFRKNNYEGASATSRSLLNYWFKIRHEKNGAPFYYYFAQREAMETIVYLVDVAAAKNINHDLKRARVDKDGNATLDIEEDLDETWRRYVVKMATGVGKTKVLALVIAWSYFHKLYEKDSSLARNFLLIAPNIIVLDRLYKDFQGLDIFYADPVLPPNGFDSKNWQDDFQDMELHKQNDIKATKTHGNIFLTNIHRVYKHDIREPSPEDSNLKPYFTGKEPEKDMNAPDIKLRDIVRDIDELVILNDEAHHIHDKKLAWFQSIKSIHTQLAFKGKYLSLQLDVTATPKDSQRRVFPKTISDYTLVEAIHQELVKHPVLPNQDSRNDLIEHEHRLNYSERYRDYINLGVEEWRKTYIRHKEYNKKTILFVMTENISACDEVTE